MNENVVKNASRYLQNYDKTQADVAKLHNEVNQLRNQELLINSFAITIVAVFMTSEIKNGFISVLTLILLFLIGCWQHNILITRAYITTYLRIFFLSKWEEDYRKLVKNKIFPSMRKFNYCLFISLGFIVFVTAIQLVEENQLQGLLLIAAIVIYFDVFVYFLSIDEKQALDQCEQEWKQKLNY